MSRDEVPKEELQTWLASVAQEADLLRESEVEAPHTSEWNRGVLAWFAKYFVENDPELLDFPDGPSDGGMDIVSITELEDITRIDVYQVSAPKQDNLAQGKASTVAPKFEEDARQFRNTVIGKAKKLKSLNSTAREVLRKINRAREQSADDSYVSPHIEIQIHPLTLNRAHPDAHRRIEEVQDEARKEWTSSSETWKISEIRDLPELYRHHVNRRPKEETPKQLNLALVGDLAADHPKRGPFLCFLKASDLVDAYQKWGAGFLDPNLRYYLGRTEVNRIMENELDYVSNITWFHEKNNGIVITCDSCNQSKGSIRVKSPQIVNGGQTVHTIAGKLQLIEETPLEKRSDKEVKLLEAIRNDLKIAAKIVIISGGKVQKPDEIAMASNTQNKLSERTMKSSRSEMRDLRIKLAAMDPPWYAITKDGEWSAVAKNKSLLQSKSDNRVLKDFRVAGNRYRRVDNTDLGVALLAFYGFVREAKPSRVFKKKYVVKLFGWHLGDEHWEQMSRNRIAWDGEIFGKVFEPGQVFSSQWLLAYLTLAYWRAFTYPESKHLLMAYEERGEADPEFLRQRKKPSGWDVPEELQAEVLADQDSCYWPEQVAKSAYLVLVYQTMRVLYHRFGRLDNETCAEILRLPEFTTLAAGRAVSDLKDFREGSLSDGPLTAIGRILLYSCKLLWNSDEDKIRTMAQRQQVLLRDQWISRLCEKVDMVCDRFGQPSYRHAAGLEGPDDSSTEIGGLDDILGAIEFEDANQNT